MDSPLFHNSTSDYITRAYQKVICLMLYVNQPVFYVNQGWACFFYYKGKPYASHTVFISYILCG